MDLDVIPPYKKKIKMPLKMQPKEIPLKKDDK